MANVALQSTGSLPVFKMLAGSAQPATYKAKLKLADGTAIDLGNNNEVDFKKVADVTSVSKLNGSQLVWDVKVIKATKKKTEVHSITVFAFQDGAEMFKQKDPNDGEFGDMNTHGWHDSLTFIVV